MHCASVKDQVRERQREQQESDQSRNGGRAGEAGPVRDEPRDIPPVRPIEPEEIAVFVQDEDLRLQVRAQPPLPFGHDRLARANHPHDGILAGVKVGQNPIAGSRAAVFGDTKHASVETLRQAGVAGDQVDFELVPEEAAERGYDALNQMARTAFDQQDS